MRRPCLAFALLAVIPAALPAQSPDRDWAGRGPFLGASYVAGWIQFPEMDGAARAGSGSGVRAGYAFNRRVAAFADATRLEMDLATGEGSLRVLEAGVQLALVKEAARMVPIAELAGARMAFTVAERGVGESTFDGIAITAGLALQYFVVRDLAVGGRVRYTAGVLDDAMPGSDGSRIDTDARLRRFSVFAAWQLPILR